MKTNSEYYRKIRVENREKGRKKAKRLSRDYMYGCILYWTEGSKGRHTVDFANSDIVMVKYFLNFLRKHFKVEDEKVSISINAYLNNGISLGDIEEYWLDHLELPRMSLRKFTNRAKYYSPVNKRAK